MPNTTRHHNTPIPIGILNSLPAHVAEQVIDLYNFGCVVNSIQTKSNTIYLRIEYTNPHGVRRTTCIKK